MKISLHTAKIEIPLITVPHSIIKTLSRMQNNLKWEAENTTYNFLNSLYPHPHRRDYNLSEANQV